MEKTPRLGHTRPKARGQKPGARGPGDEPGAGVGNRGPGPGPGARGPSPGPGARAWGPGPAALGPRSRPGPGVRGMGQGHPRSHPAGVWKTSVLTTMNFRDSPWYQTQLNKVHTASRPVPPNSPLIRRLSHASCMATCSDSKKIAEDVELAATRMYGS